MTHGSKGMGSHRHGTCGKNNKSPRLRLFERMEAERGAIPVVATEKPPEQRIKMYGSVQELLRDRV